MQILATLAALSAAIATAQAGSAYVYNHCKEVVYLWAVDTERIPGSPVKISPGGSWSETYRTPQSGGVSIKLSKEANVYGKITQFEYTLTGGQWNQIWYDGSDIDCITSKCPFAEDNLFLGASVPSCPQRYCAAADPKCTGFYNKPDDDFATLACEPTADTFMHLCLPDDQMPGGSSPPAPPTQPSSSSTATPTSTKNVHTFTMEAPVATTFVKAHKTARSVAERSPEPEALAVHAHARRHLHHRL
jgi:hypothetical protein